jgi:D-3-phosphoglycerate dehydrogenase / 2-oxoglutarate reductase
MGPMNLGNLGSQGGLGRVLICDELSPAALGILRDRGLEPEVRLGLSEDELVEAAPGVQALVVRSATKVTRRVIEAASAASSS